VRGWVSQQSALLAAFCAARTWGGTKSAARTSPNGEHTLLWHIVFERHRLDERVASKLQFGVSVRPVSVLLDAGATASHSPTVPDRRMFNTGCGGELLKESTVSDACSVKTP